VIGGATEVTGRTAEVHPNAGCPGSSALIFQRRADPDLDADSCCRVRHRRGDGGFRPTTARFRFLPPVRREDLAVKRVSWA